MPVRRFNSVRIRLERGMSLIESLVAILVLALGLLGLAGVQARLLADNRANGSRAIAIGLIDDMTNRILLNRQAAMQGSYNIAWSGTTTARDCVTAACTPAQTAQSDLNIWMETVRTRLPGGTATIFQSTSDNRQIGIAIGWDANEGGTSSSDRTSRVNLLNTSVTGTTCPSNDLCQIAYVQP